MPRRLLPLLLLIAARAAAAEPPARLDAHGMPLPPGAVARCDTGRLRRDDETQAGVIAPVHFVAFADGGRLITASHGWHELLCVWDAADGRPLRRIPLDGYWRGHRLLDGRTVAAVGDRGPRAFDVATGKEGEVTRPLEWAVPLADGPARVDHTATGQSVLSADGRWAATVNAVESPFQTNVPQYMPGGHLQLWDTKTRQPVWANGEPPKPHQFPRWERSVFVVGFSPDGRLLLWREGDQLHLLDTRTPTERAVVRVPALDGAGVCSADGRTLAVGSAVTPTVRLIDLNTGGERLRFDTGQKGVAGLALARDGRRLATGGVNTTAMVWDVTALAGARAAPREVWPDLWDDLSADEARAFRAVRSLAASPDAAAWLEERLRGHVAAPSPERLARLVADLDDDDFTVRERATQQLRRLRRDARPALLRARQAEPSLELLRRADELLADPQLMTPSAATLQG